MTKPVKDKPQKRPKKPKPEQVLRRSPDDSHEAFRAELLEQDAHIDALYALIDDLNARLDALAPPTT